MASLIDLTLSDLVKKVKSKKFHQRNNICLHR